MSEFFEKLQDIVKLEENVEGIREILLTIYRNGTISTKKISKITKIPIPVVSRIINILIERNMLSRNELGVQFWEHSMKFIEEHFKFYGYGIQKCPECDGRPNYISPRFEELFEILNPIFENRPSVDTTFDQSKNTVETSIQRALYFYDNGALEGKNVLFFGDDDFTSVAVAALYKCFFPEDPKLVPKSVTVIDIDDRILAEIKNTYEKFGFPIECIHYNAKDEIPLDLLKKFDTIITDPPYSLNGLKLFLSRVISLLDIDTHYKIGKDIFLSFAHRSAERTYDIQFLLVELGLTVIEQIPRFNRYEGSEVLGNQTQMFHIKTTTKTKPLIQSLDPYTGDLYTGETHPYIKQYKCKECGSTIVVGPDHEFVTIEQLKGNKCPDCKNSVKFDLIGRNIDSIKDDD